MGNWGATMGTRKQRESLGDGANIHAMETRGGRKHGSDLQCLPEISIWEGVFVGDR